MQPSFLGLYYVMVLSVCPSDDGPQSPEWKIIETSLSLTIFHIAPFSGINVNGQRHRCPVKFAACFRKLRKFAIMLLSWLLLVRGRM